MEKICVKDLMPNEGDSVLVFGIYYSDEYCMLDDNPDWHYVHFDTLEKSYILGSDGYYSPYVTNISHWIDTRKFTNS